MTQVDSHCDIVTVKFGGQSTELLVIITGGVEIEAETIRYIMPSYMGGTVTKMLRTPVSKEYVWNHTKQTVIGTVYRIVFSASIEKTNQESCDLLVENIRYLLRSPVTNLAQFFALRDSTDGFLANVRPDLVKS